MLLNGDIRYHGYIFYLHPIFLKLYTQGYTVLWNLSASFH